MTDRRITKATYEALTVVWSYLCTHIDDCTAQGDHDSAEDWMPTRDALRRVSDTKTIAMLADERLARWELMRLLDGPEYRTATDRPTLQASDIVRDLCRAGHYEVHNPETVCISTGTGLRRKPRTLRVDGILYDIDCTREAHATYGDTGEDDGSEWMTA